MGTEAAVRQTLTKADAGELLEEICSDIQLVPEDEARRAIERMTKQGPTADRASLAYGDTFYQDRYQDKAYDDHYADTPAYRDAPGNY